MNEQLSLQRLGWLLRSDLLRRYRAVAVIAGTVALLALLVSLIDAYYGILASGQALYRTVFLIVLFSWGLIGTSECFRDLHGRTTNFAFLTLPASSLEKALSRLLLYSVGLFVGVLALTTVLSWLLEGINTLLFDVRRETFVPTDRVVWLMLPHYVVAQGLFFLGAAWFRSVYFLKTVGAALLIVFGLATIAVALAWMIGPTPCRNVDCLQFPFVDWLVDAAPVAYTYLLPPFCWFVAWLRVSEAQVSHGV